MARLAATYGLAGFYVVTPLEDQQRLVEDMTRHWRQGPGEAYNPDRAQAFDLVQLVANMDEMRASIRTRTGGEPILVGTSAANRADSATLNEVTALLEGQQPVCLVFGTAWGLADEAIEKM